MIDFHSHIIPNVDDGSKSVEETFELLKEAKEAGFSGVISTSHYIEGYYETNVNERSIWIKAISENLSKKQIELDLYLGNEIYITKNVLNLLKSNNIATINNSNYILFELPMNAKPMNMYDIIYDMLEYGLIPILAHPERYVYVQKEPELIYDLIQKGVLMQSNYGSILGLYGEKAEIIVKKMLENNMVHFLGSDVHKKHTIYPKIKEALNKIENIVGPEKLEELSSSNPKMVLENKKIYIDEAKKIKLSIREKMIVNLKK